MLATADTKEELNENRDSIEDCEKMFEAASQGLEIYYNGDWQHMPAEVPLVTDIYGLQPLDYALGINRHSQKERLKELEAGEEIQNQYNYKFVPISSEVKNVVDQSKNLQLVQDIFTYTKGYGFYHNSMNMVQPIIQAV